MMSVQAFLRFIPSSRFHAKEVEFAIDLSSASVIARQVMEDAISFFYLSEPGLTKEEKRFRELVWRFHGATEAIDSAAFMGSAHETEKIVRLGLPRIIRLKENAPELDYSSFYVTLAREHRLPCCAGFSLADQGSQSHPRGDFAPYRALFSVSCAHPMIRLLRRCSKRLRVEGEGESGKEGRIMFYTIARFLRAGECERMKPMTHTERYFRISPISQSSHIK
jgi:hypothetical protein